MAELGTVLLDACCVINLYASGRISDILRSLPIVVAIATHVLQKEALYVLHVRDDGVIEKISVNLAPLVASHLISLMDIESLDEQAAVVNFAALRFDDGEAVTAALALHRGAAVATDERRILGVLRTSFPQVAVITTSALVWHWADQTKASPGEVRAVLRNIEEGGRFVPPRDDPYYAWWQRART